MVRVPPTHSLSHHHLATAREQIYDSHCIPELDPAAEGCSTGAESADCRRAHRAKISKLASSQAAIHLAPAIVMSAALYSNVDSKGKPLVPFRLTVSGREAS